MAILAAVAILCTGELGKPFISQLATVRFAHFIADHLTRRILPGLFNLLSSILFRDVSILIGAPSVLDACPKPSSARIRSHLQCPTVARLLKMPVDGPRETRECAFHAGIESPAAQAVSTSASTLGQRASGGT